MSTWTAVALGISLGTFIGLIASILWVTALFRWHHQVHDEGKCEHQAAVVVPVLPSDQPGQQQPLQ